MVGILFYWTWRGVDLLPTYPFKGSKFHVVLFFFFSIGSDSLNSFSFLLNFSSVIAFGFVASSDESNA